MSDSDEREADGHNNRAHEFVFRESIDVIKADINLHVTIHEPFYKVVDHCRYLRLHNISNISRGTETLLMALTRKQHDKKICKRARGKLVRTIRKARDATFGDMVRKKSTAAANPAKFDTGLTPRSRDLRAAAMGIDEVIDVRMEGIEGAVPECVIKMLLSSSHKNKRDLWVQATAASLKYLMRASLYHANFDEGDDTSEDKADEEDECDDEDQKNLEGPEADGEADKEDESDEEQKSVESLEVDGEADASSRPEAPVGVVKKRVLSDWFAKRSKQ